MPAKIDFTDEAITQMRRTYESGVSFGDIAKQHACATNTIRSVLLAVGVAPDPRRSLSIKAMGRPSPRRGAKWTEETRAKFIATRASMPHRGRTGPHSAETIAKISAATKGKNVRYTPEQRRHNEAVRQACKRFVRRVLSASGKRKVIPSEQYVGYSNAQLVAHLGPRPDGAHIDHYVPVAEFLRRGIAEPKVINALVNLRWLDGAENQRKSDRVPLDADAVVAACLRAAGLSM